MAIFDMTKHYFPRITTCASCDLEYKCICLYDSFHYICLGCGRQSQTYHPPYKEKIIQHYCIEYEHHREWYRDANLHNEVGPAVEILDFFTKTTTHKIWYVDGIRVHAKTLEEFLQSKEYKRFKLKAFI